MFWEEKIIYLLRILELFGLIYVAFYEQWPTIDGEEGMFFFNFWFVFYEKDYYQLIVDKQPWLINLGVWAAIMLIFVVCSSLCWLIYSV